VLRETARAASTDAGWWTAVPIRLGEATPEAWITAGPADVNHPGAATLQAALEIAAAGLAGVLAQQRLEAERDLRRRADLLGELLATAGPLPPQLAERLIQAGWRTAGWHTGVHALPADATAAGNAATTTRIAELLAHAGVRAHVVQVADGWSAWASSEAEPDAAAWRTTVRAVRAVVTAAAPELVLHGGVGSPHAGAGGLAETLIEARQAAVLATAAGPRPAVEHAGELATRRLLLGWYGSEAFRAHAESLLAPIAGEPELLATLEAYLDLESSTASTASLLGVHRNTVAHRIRRTEQLLGVNLAQPDERLTLQLACRVLRARPR
jgi:hypothetical protein